MNITETILCKYNHNNHTLFLTFNLIFVSSAELSTVNQFFCLILIEKELYTMSRPLVKSVFGNISPINLGEDFMIIEDANLKEIEGEDVRSESCIIFYCISGSLCLIVGSEKITIKSGQVVYLLKGQMLKILYVSGSLQVTLLLIFEPFLQCLDLKN